MRFGAPQTLVPEADSELCTLYVQEPFTGQGVGAALLQAAREGSGGLWLMVNAQNLRACRFYEKHGFAVRGSTDFVLGEGRHRNHVLGMPRAAITGA